MSSTKARREVEQWQNLILRDGADTWRSRVERARRATAIYGGWFCLAAVVSLIVRIHAPEFWMIIPVVYVINLIAILWAAREHEPILPFVPASRWSHYPASVIVGLLGVVSWVVWLSLWLSASKASKHIEQSVRALPNADGGPGEAMSPVVMPAPETALARSPEEFEAWKIELDRYLDSVGSATRHSDFRKESLAYGFAHSMGPADFVKFGYNKALAPEDMARLFGDNRPPKVEAPSREEERQPEPVEPEAGLDPSEHGDRQAAPADQTAADSLTALFELYRSGAITSDEFKTLRANLERK